MAKVRERPATYEDLLKVPDHMVAEIVEGELFVSPRPATRHARATGALYNRLSRFDEGDGGGGLGEWWILIEPELHLGRDVMVPDIAGWRREGMPLIPDAPAIDQTPDWVCEVVSPYTGRLDRARKLPRYASYGVGHAWVVDPIIKVLEVFRGDGEHFMLITAFEGSSLVRAEPFDAIELDLGALWLPD